MDSSLVKEDALKKLLKLSILRMFQMNCLPNVL